MFSCLFIVEGHHFVDILSAAFLNQDVSLPSIFILLMLITECATDNTNSDCSIVDFVQNIFYGPNKMMFEDKNVCRKTVQLMPNISLRNFCSRVVLQFPLQVKKEQSCFCLTNVTVTKNSCKARHQVNPWNPKQLSAILFKENRNYHTTN